MASLSDVFVEVKPQTDRFEPELRRRLSRIDASKQGKQVATRFGVGFHGAFGSIVSRSAGLFVAGFAAVKSLQVFGGFINEARESEKISRITANAIRATGGAAKITAGQVGQLAEGLSNKTAVDDEAIQSGANLLLTFTGVRNAVGQGNDIFNQASAAIVDMTAAMNNGKVSTEGIKSSSIQVGKALNDPIKGITALTRVGVTFTEQQKKQITQMVKSGDTLGAQKIILGELKKEFGGTAAAAADPMQRLTVILGNLGEQIGSALLPVIDRLAAWLGGRVVPAVQSFIAGLQGQGAIAGFVGRLNTLGLGLRALVQAFRDPDVTSKGFIGSMERIGVAARRTFDYFQAEVLPRLKQFAAFVGTQVVPRLIALAGWIGRNRDFFIPFVATILTGVAVLKTIVAVTKTWAAVQAILNVVLTANPIGLIIVAVAALVAGLVVAYKRSETFRRIVDAAFRAVKAAAEFAFNWVRRNWPLLLAIITGPIGIATLTVIKNWDRIKGAASAVLTWIRRNWPQLLVILTGPIGAATILVVRNWARITAAAQAMRDAVGRVIGSVVSFVAGVPGRISRAVGTMRTLLTGAGGNLITGLLSGISGALRNIGAWVRDHIVNPIIGAVKRFFGISSPSRVFAGIGGNLMAGLARGMLRQNVGTLITKVFGSMPKALGAIVSKGLISVASLPGKALKALGGLGGKFLGLLGGAGSFGGGGGNASNMALGQLMARARGWVGAQWEALRQLWIGESGWNNLADNPTSTAFGIPQFIASTARAYGVLGVTDPARQIAAGMQYIADAYGSPVAALAAWASRSPHWYDRGGWLPPGLSLAYNGTGIPERVLPPGGGSGATYITVNVAGVVGMTKQDLRNTLVEELDALQRRRRI